MTIPVVAHSMTPVYIAQSKGFFAERNWNWTLHPRAAAGRTSGR